MSTESQPYATITIHPGIVHSFNDLDDLRGFVIAECNAWEWAYNLRNRDPYNVWANPAFEHSENMRRLLDAAKSSPNDDHVKGQLIGSVASAWGEFGPCIHSQSPLGQWIANVKGKYGVNTAVMACRHSLQPANDQGINERAAALAILYQYGIYPDGRHEANDKLFQELSEDVRKCRKDWGELLASVEENRRQLADEHSTFVNERNNLFDTLKERFLRIYEVGEPAKYWSRKSWQHFWWGKLWGALTLVVGGAGGTWLYREAQRPHPELPDDASFWRILPELYPLLIISIGLLWLLRIMVRSYLSHVHLQADAAERVVMAKTFLAFREGHGERELDKEVLPIVLHQLFRHTVTGFIKDDAAPQLPASMLTKD